MIRGSKQVLRLMVSSFFLHGLVQGFLIPDKLPDIGIIGDIGKEVLNQIPDLTISNLSDITNYLKPSVNITALIEKLNKLLKTSHNSIAHSQIAKAFSSISKYVDKVGIEIPEEALSEAIELVNTFISSQESEQLLKDETVKYGIVVALNTLSYHLEHSRQDVYSKNTEYLEIQVTNANKSNYSSFEITGKAKCFIPKSAIQMAYKKSQVKNTSLSIPYVLYKNPNLFSNVSSPNFTIHQVLQASVANISLTKLPEPLWYEFGAAIENCLAVKNKSKSIRTYKCNFWNATTNQWSGKGCSIIPESNPPRCECSHTTNFALLVRTLKSPTDYTLDVIVYIGCSFSITALLMMMFINLRFKVLRTNKLTQIHSFLGLNLLAMYIIMLIGLERPRAYNSCVAVTFAVHFFVLSAWGWMVVECITMCRQFLVVFTTITQAYICKAALLVCLLSASVTTGTYAISTLWLDNTVLTEWKTIGCDTKPSYYLSARMCWLHGYSLYFGFLTPIAIMFLCNVIGAFVILNKIICRKEIAVSKARSNDAKSTIRRLFTVSILLGLTWIFAIPIATSDNETVNIVCGWLFSISSALQGVAIFFLFCWNKTDVRKLWFNPIVKIIRHNTRKNTLNNLSYQNRTTNVSTSKQNLTGYNCTKKL